MIKNYKEYKKMNESVQSNEYKYALKRKLWKFSREKDWFLYGLRLRSVIDDFLRPLSQQIDGNTLQKYQYPLSLLYKSNNRKMIEKIGEDRYYCRALKGYFILEDGEWSYLNKLNTNIGALTDLIADFFEYLYIKYDPKKENPKGTNPELDPFGEEDWSERSPEYYTLGLLDLLDMDDYEFKTTIRDYIYWDTDDGTNLMDYLNLKFANRYDLHKYTKIIKENSEKGERAENLASDFLTRKGANVLYQGGNGNLIDMVFGSDLIIEKNNKILTVQVKSYSLEKVNLKEYHRVDVIIGISENEPITMFYDNKLHKFKQ